MKEKHGKLVLAVEMLVDYERKNMANYISTCCGGQQRNLVLSSMDAEKSDV